MLLQFHYYSDHFGTKRDKNKIRVVVKVDLKPYEEDGLFEIESIYDETDGYDISQYNVPYAELKIIKIKAASFIDEYIKLPYYYIGDY